MKNQECDIISSPFFYSGFDKELTNQKPKIKEIEFGDGGEREIIVSNQNSQVPQIQSESAQAVVANSKPDIKLSGPQVTILLCNFAICKINCKIASSVRVLRNYV